MASKLKLKILPIFLILIFSAYGFGFNQTTAPGKVLGGSLDSPIKIEVFSNFECSHCREYYLRTIKRILKEYSASGKVCVIYYDFPFQSHRYDRETARYAEAAYRLGQDILIKVFDALYTDQAEWSQNGQIEQSLAKVLPKDTIEELKQIAKDPEIDKLIDAQYSMAVERGLTSTPTSYIYYNGKHQKVESLIVYIILKSFIDEQLNE